ncbi:MAG: Ig-like domain-containing protein, partial [Pseudomonadota bacterium]
PIFTSRLEASAFGQSRFQSGRFSRWTGITSSNGGGGITITDGLPPVYVSSDPLQGATEVDTRSTITLRFNEEIAAGPGVFTLRDVAGDVTVETFDGTGAGSNGGSLEVTGLEVTLTPGAALAGLNSFAVQWDAGAVEDGAGNPVAENASDTLVSFSTAGTALETDPNVAAIDVTGWLADYTSPPTFDPAGDPRYVVVARQGHDAAGAPITVSDDLLIMARLREPYPDQANLTPSNVVLSDFVYGGDAVSGVANNSTAPYPKPICLWLDHDGRRVYDRSYTARLAVAHWHARNGRPVAAVEFTATDGTTTVSSGKITAMTKADYAVSGLSLPCFEASLDFASLSDDALITIDATIYPWVGPSWTASSDFASYPSINFCELKVFNAVTAAEAPIYAYVDGVGAGAPEASTTEATAAANPFDDIKAAASAIAALSGTDVSRGVIVLTETTHTINDTVSVTVGDTPLLVRATSSAAQATTILQNTSSGGEDSCAKIKFQNLTLQANVEKDQMLDMGNNTSAANMLVTENCVFDDNGLGLDRGTFVFRVGRWYALECSSNFYGLANRFTGSNLKMLNVIGCGSGFAGSMVYNMAATKDMACQ